MALEWMRLGGMLTCLGGMFVRPGLEPMRFTVRLRRTTSVFIRMEVMLPHMKKVVRSMSVMPVSTKAVGQGVTEEKLGPGADGRGPTHGDAGPTPRALVREEEAFKDPSPLISPDSKTLLPSKVWKLRSS